jgi:hypothetical protein
MPDTSPWMDQQGTADYLSCSVRQVQLLQRAGKLPCSYHLGPRSPRYHRDDVDRAMGREPQEKQTTETGLRVAAG